MTRETLVSVATALMPVAITILSLAGAWAAAMVARHIASRRYALAVQLLAYGAAAIVADIAQNIVKDLKDPAKPGAWDAVAKASARTTAIDRLKRLYPTAIGIVTEALQDPTKVDQLLGTQVEAAVVALDRASQSPTVIVNSVPPPALPAAAAPSPPADPPAPKGSPGRASVGHLVAVVVLSIGVSLVGCPRLPPVSGCHPTDQRCAQDRPEVCSASQRWEPAADTACSSVGGVCVVGDAGVAHCALTPTAATATDGNAR